VTPAVAKQPPPDAGAALRAPLDEPPAVFEHRATLALAIVGAPFHARERLRLLLELANAGSPEILEYIQASQGRSISRQAVGKVCALSSRSDAVQRAVEDILIGRLRLPRITVQSLWVFDAAD
jgi:hypothetical protein